MSIQDLSDSASKHTKNLEAIQAEAAATLAAVTAANERRDRFAERVEKVLQEHGATAMVDELDEVANASDEQLADEAWVADAAKLAARARALMAAVEEQSKERETSAPLAGGISAAVSSASESMKQMAEATAATQAILREEQPEAPAEENQGGADALGRLEELIGRLDVGLSLAKVCKDMLALPHEED